MNTPQWIDQARLQADANAFLDYVLEQMNNPFNPLPDQQKIILEYWIPIIKSLTNSDALREAIVNWINTTGGSVPPN